MPKYYVEVPVLTRLMVEVKADNQQAAQDKVFNSGINIDIVDKENTFEYFDYTWEMHEKLTQGNVFWGDIHSIDIQEVEDDEDEDDE